METVIGVLAAAFVIALVIGMAVRAARAPSGQRARAAFGPIMGAGETYQELHTGQRGLQDSVIEAIAQQEQRPARTDADGDPDAGGPDDDGRSRPAPRD